MNLLIYAPQMAAYGGMERHLCLVAEAMAATGANVAFVTTSNSLAPAWRERLRCGGVELHEMPAARGSASGYAKAWWLLRRSLALRRRRWDTVYTNGQGALARILWLAARRGARRVHHHHTAADAAEQRSWSPGFLRVLVRAGELVGCSRFTASQLNAATGRSDARFLPYFTETAFVAAPPPARARTAGEPLRFGFLGRLVSTKGIETILRLAADPACAEIQWHIHGSGSDYPPEFFAERPGVVYHGGYANPTEQAAALASLDAVALFSVHNEGMPLSLIETMASGLPWVATARGGTPELAESAPDCELIAHPENYEECRAGVLALSTRIRAFSTSQTAQRGVWERRFAPCVVREQWITYLGFTVDG
jgi:glycosyltransferase involved in cell wall biosynthesis